MRRWLFVSPDMSADKNFCRRTCRHKKVSTATNFRAVFSQFQIVMGVTTEEIPRHRGIISDGSNAVCKRYFLVLRYQKYRNWLFLCLRPMAEVLSDAYAKFRDPQDNTFWSRIVVFGLDQRSCSTSSPVSTGMGMDAFGQVNCLIT